MSMADLTYLYPSSSNDADEVIETFYNSVKSIEEIKMFLLSLGSSNKTSDDISDYIGNSNVKFDDIYNISGDSKIEALKRSEDDIMDSQGLDKYLEHIDRDMAEIRSEMGKNRREIKTDIKTAVETMVSKVDANVSIVLDKIDLEIKNLNTKHDNILDQLERTLDDFKEVKSDASTTKKWAIALTLSTLIGFIGIIIAILK